MVAPVGTRWRSDYDAIARFLEDRTAVEKLLASDRSLRTCKLSELEWSYLERLRVLLEVGDNMRVFGFFLRRNFTQAPNCLQPMALALSRVENARFPTLVTVIPLFNVIMDKLEDADFEDDPVLESVRDAILDVLRKYYGKTDDSRMYWINLGESRSDFVVKL